jgi:predicted nucleic acid-binding protein
MRAYREFITVEDPQRLVVEPQVPLKKGQRIELVLMIEDEGETLNGPVVSRTLLTENGRLVVAALPGEQAISDGKLRSLLNTMEW